MPPSSSRSVSIRDRHAIVQALIGLAPTENDFRDAIAIRPHTTAAAAGAVGRQEGSAENAVDATTLLNSPLEGAASADLAAERDQEGPKAAEDLSFHPFALRGPSGNVVEAVARPDAIPSIVEPSPAWWSRALSASAGNGSLSSAAITVTRPTALELAEPASPHHAASPLVLETAPGSPDTVVPTSPGAFDKTLAGLQLQQGVSGDYPTLLTSGSPRSASTSMFPLSGTASASPQQQPPNQQHQQPTSDVIGTLLAAPSRARPARAKPMRVFIADPAFARLIHPEKPPVLTMSRGYAAVDVVNMMIRHIRGQQTIQAKLEENAQWLAPQDFVVMRAASDGSVDPDIRVVYAGDRVVDLVDEVTLVPRATLEATACLSHKGYAAGELRPQTAMVHGQLALEVVVRYDASTESEAASGGSLTMPERYTVDVLADLSVKQLPLALCAKLFLTNVDGPLLEGSIEEESFAVQYNGIDVFVRRMPYFRLGAGGGGGSWNVPLEQLTVLQLASRGVKSVSFTTKRPAPTQLSERMESIASSSSQPNSFSDAASVLLPGAAGDGHGVYMTDLDAMNYTSYLVRKRNDRNVWQQRLFAVDKNCIYNQYPDQSGSTKRPMRNIGDVDVVTISPLNPRQCVVRYKKTSADVQQDELEFENANECKRFVKQVGILMKGADATTSRASASPERSGNFFSRLFRSS